MRLFGSLYARGRIHVSDAIVRDATEAVRRRTHVSIDRVGGGASNGFLFNADVVCQTDHIPFRISIDRPTEDESRWIACTLRAMHLGVLRVGSSKAAGRFEIAELRARGPGAEHFENIANRGEKTHG
jgi:CRISPR/Cas system CSM-associated protein Csm3 (group 7 of RAMP superfamily)